MKQMTIVPSNVRGVDIDEASTQYYVENFLKMGSYL